MFKLILILFPIAIIFIIAAAALIIWLFKEPVYESGYSYHGHHVPSGEDWHIIGIDPLNDRVCVAGWPHTIANLSDMRRMKKFAPLTQEEIHHRSKRFGTNWI